MIDLYGMSSPNVFKVSIMCEEVGETYRAHHVNVFAGAQYDPEFLKISPNNKVPAILDDEGPDGRPMALSESNAILLYLAEKHRKLLPLSGEARVRTLQWLTIQTASVGPMFGQLVHYIRYAPPNPYAMDRHTSEVKRIFSVLEQRLAESPYLGGGDYSLVDVATFPWIRTVTLIFPFLEAREEEGEYSAALGRKVVLPGNERSTAAESLRDYPNILRWYEPIAARPAVIRGTQALDILQKSDIDAFGKATPDDFDRFFSRGKYSRATATG